MTASDLGREAAAEEGAPLVPKARERWSTWRVAVTVASAATYAVGIMPVSINSPLVPVLEADPHLAWGVSDSKLFLSLPKAMEAVGCLSLGWVADAYGGAVATMCFFGVAGLGLTLVAVQEHAAAILGVFMVVWWARGIAWPAATKLVSDHLAGAQWEVGLCAVAVASRLGDAASSEFIGLAVGTIGWRGTLLAIVGLLVAASAAMRVVAWSARESRGVPAMAGAPSSALPPCERCLGMLESAGAFFAMGDSWLVLGLVLCQQPLWAFGGFLGAFAHGVYELPPRASAAVNGAYPAGMMLALLGCLAVALRGGRGSRRRIYLGASVLALGAAAIPAALLLLGPRVPAAGFVLLALLQGVCTGVLNYVPPSVWCMHAGRAKGDGAFLAGLLYSIGYFFAFLVHYAIGHVRGVSELAGFRLELALACASGLLSSALLLKHTRNHWSGGLFAA